jgi:hypothetical protein
MNKSNSKKEALDLSKVKVINPDYDKQLKLFNHDINQLSLFNNETDNIRK